jgi:hypothetical protein
MKISEVAPLISACQDANDSLLMTGVHGIGKSDVVEEWAKENNVHLEILFLSNQEVGDLIGIPHNRVENGKTIEEWSVPSWLDRMNTANANGQKTALFLDEISRAPSDVKQAALQLVLAKKIHEHKLPTLNDTDTVIIAADNPDNGNYQVEPMDPALLDRFLTVDVDIDVEAWLEWARKKNVNKIIRAFIADNPTKLHFVPDEGEMADKTSATPRSWAKLGSYVDNFQNIGTDLHYNIIAGKVGKAFAAQLINFISNYETLISIEDVEELTADLRKKTNNIEMIGSAIAELISESESVQITEITMALINKYIDGTADEAYPLMAMLYGLHIEILISVFKKLAKENPSHYKQVVEFDTAINKKRLFIKAADAIVV